MMNRQHTQTANKAVPLCLPNNIKWDPETGSLQNTGEVRRTLHIVDEAVAQLRKIREPVSVVSIVGPCRDGKSFILSEAFGQPDVFPVGFKMDPETMGIWIWILPDMVKDRSGRDVRVVLLDSEGTEFAASEGQHDNQIFTLTVLMASILIYNSKGVPKRNDLNQLNFIVRLSQQIQARSDITTRRPITNEDAFHQTFPHFVWLLRDVMTDIPDDCRDIREYFLTRVFKGSEALKNDQTQCIAESIMNYFSGFDAFCLPPPAYNKELMKDFRRNKDKMNPEFFTEVNRFEELLKSKMGPKKSCNEGEYVTGEGLATLTELYVEAINDPNNVPNVQTAWETYVQDKCKKAKNKAMMAYDKKIKAELSKLPCDGEKILASHESATREMMAIFNQETKGIASDRTKHNFEELMNKGLQKLGEWKNKNDRLTKEACEKLVKELKKKHLDPVLERVRGPEGAKVSFKEIDDGCAIIELEYKSRAVGSKDVRAQVFHEFHQQFKIERDRYKDVLKNLKDYDENLLTIRLENTKKEEDMERLRTDNDYLIKEQKIQEEKLKELEDKKTKELEEKLREFKAREDILNNKIIDLEKAGMENRIYELEKERDEAREEKEQWESELRNLKVELAELKKQLRLANRPFWKKWFNIDGERQPTQ